MPTPTTNETLYQLFTHILYSENGTRVNYELERIGNTGRNFFSLANSLDLSVIGLVSIA